VVALIARQGIVPVAIGLVAGVAAGLGLGQVMRGLLFDVSPTDPLTIAATVGLLAGCGPLRDDRPGPARGTPRSADGAAG
jgi:hypothetical protein